jgi:hypothetical protein
MPAPHQSRVFTFIGNRTNQLKNTCAKGLRQLKVVIVWSSQILLYPLQLLAQTKIFPPQIPSPPPAPLLPEPAPDINIEQALDLVEGAGHPIQIVDRAAITVDDWSYIDDRLWNTSYGNTAVKSQEIAYSPRATRQVTAAKPTIQGLSSLLSDRQLVLVTTENELLDILTLEQQQEIRRRIGIDLATTWYQWQTNSTQQFDANNDLSLPEARTKEFNGDRQLLLASQTVDEDLELRPENFFDRLRQWFGRSNDTSQSLDLSLYPDLISEIEPPAPQQLAPASYTFTPQPPKFDRYLDLPQLPPISEPELPRIVEPESRFNPTDLLTKFQPNWLKQWWNYYQEYIYIPTEADSAIVHQPAEDFQLIAIETTPSKIKANQSDRSDRIEQMRVDRSNQQHRIESSHSIARATKSAQHLEYQQDWIEAESEQIGYSQSILARLLAWLDRLMLRLENWIISLFTAITDRFKPNS